MLQRYRLVVFDWEGTLAESGLGYVLNAVELAAERLHLGQIDGHIAREAVPLGLANAIKKLFPTASLHQQEDILVEAQKALSALATKTQMVPGAEDTVRFLAQEGMSLAIATNRSAQGLLRALQSSGLDTFFQITRSATEAPSKPCPQMLEEIMDVLQMDATQTLMVGDSISDIEMASAIGVDAVGMDFFHVEEQSLRAAGACEVFDDYQALQQYIKDN
ncbi:MAG: HAD-IA family hydrolase [Gammaproteobacteria bacterium]|nr:HAD-IA family hydrolase [Gammaproteobacteria bacterium]